MVKVGGFQIHVFFPPYQTPQDEVEKLLSTWKLDAFPALRVQFCTERTAGKQSHDQARAFPAGLQGENMGKHTSDPVQ